MSKEKTTLGKIHVSPNAVATIAYHATLRSYGVVGLASKNLASGLAQTITKDPTRGVSVHYDENDQIDIDIYVIVQHGTRIASVATSVANTVRFNVEKALGVAVNSIDVHVAGLRVGDGQ
ncbi:MAG: Asp23/Gls24 family envelope stress response protein [Chloroflexi bacterium]|nr:Asp23/Gls24 family envelope stress response protein [Chloroflexota bacterium]